MSLIGMAIYSTHENKKDDCLKQTLDSLFRTVDFTRHRLILSINGFTDKTNEIIDTYTTIIENIIVNDENIGTAAAINKAWKFRNKDEHCLKMDDDVVIHSKGWLDELEAAIESDPRIGQCALKRKDCWEHPSHTNPDYKSELIMLPHTLGHTWQIVEKVKHCIGTCVLHSSALIDKAGALFQFGSYGYDDVIYSHRCYIAGFYSCFLPHINIDHIDPGNTPYQDWKHKHSGGYTKATIDLVHEMYNGTKPFYYPFL